MIINIKNLTDKELTEVTEDLAPVLTKPHESEAAFMFWRELLKGILAETDRRIAENAEK